MCWSCVSFKVSETGLSRVTSGSSLLWTPEECFDSAKLFLKFPRIVPSLHTSNKKVYKTLYLSVSCFFLRSFHFVNILAWTGGWWSWCLVCAVQNLFWRIQTSRLQGGGGFGLQPPPSWLHTVTLNTYYCWKFAKNVKNMGEDTDTCPPSRKAQCGKRMGLNGQFTADKCTFEVWPHFPTYIKSYRRIFANILLLLCLGFSQAASSQGGNTNKLWADSYKPGLTRLYWTVLD